VAKSQRHWTNDLVFPEGDAQALAAILERMIREPIWWEEVGLYGITRVHQHYTHERIAERLLIFGKQYSDKKAGRCHG
jgi:glycosyltransferase involved in cell wall biosynthesis